MTSGRETGSWGIRNETGAPRFYRGIRSAVKMAMRGFYRSVEVTGRAAVQTDRPTILASNHPNSIVDPLLVGLLEERQVHFCARDGLFKVPVFGALLRSVGAIPIYRRSDHKGPVDNSNAFEACRDVLSGDGVISIFPEGKTHDRLSVQEIKTGAARIALDAALNSESGRPVQIVPVGLNYLVRQAFRSDVHVAFGEPIDVTEFVELAKQDPRKAALALTARVEMALREVSIHVDEVEDERIIAQVTSIIADIRSKEGLDGRGQSPAERTALVRRIVDAYRWFQHTEPEETAELRRRLQGYLEMRQRLGLGGGSAALQHRSENSWLSEMTWEQKRRFLVFGAPAFALGFANSVAPYWSLRAVLKVMNPRKDRQALTKLLAGASIYSAFWAAQTSVMAIATGPLIGTLYGMTLPASAFFALRYMTEARLHRISPKGIKAFWSHGGDLQALRLERDALRVALGEMRDKYLSHIEATLADEGVIDTTATTSDSPRANP